MTYHDNNSDDAGAYEIGKRVMRDEIYTPDYGLTSQLLCLPFELAWKFGKFSYEGISSMWAEKEESGLENEPKSIEKRLE